MQPWKWAWGYKGLFFVIGAWPVVAWFIRERFYRYADDSWQTSFVCASWAVIAAWAAMAVFSLDGIMPCTQRLKQCFASEWWAVQQAGVGLLAATVAAGLSALTRWIRLVWVEYWDQRWSQAVMKADWAKKLAAGEAYKEHMAELERKKQEANETRWWKPGYKDPQHARGSAERNRASRASWSAHAKDVPDDTLRLPTPPPVSPFQAILDMRGDDVLTPEETRAIIERVESISDPLKALMVLLRLSSDEVATLLGISRSYVNMLLASTRSLSGELRDAIKRRLIEHFTAEAMARK